MPLGLQDGRIPPMAFTASSAINFNHGAERARLFKTPGHGRVGAWVARQANSKQWLKVDLKKITKITGIATMGRYRSNQWVTKYMVSFSKDCRRFKSYTEHGRLRVCQN